MDTHTEHHYRKAPYYRACWISKKARDRLKDYKEKNELRSYSEAILHLLYKVQR